MPLLVRKIGTYAGILLLIGVVLYTGARTKDVLFGSPLKISEVQTQQSTSPIIKLEGTAKHAKEVLVNGHPLETELSGNFSDTLALVPGYNIITVRATDSFGRTKEKSFSTYYKGEPATAVAQVQENIKS